MIGSRRRLAVSSLVVLLVASVPFAVVPSTAVADGTGSPQIIHAQLDFDGRTRTYRLYLPSSFGDQGPVPLLLGLHGNHSSGDDFAATSGYDAKAEQEGFLIVYPDAVNGIWNGGYSKKSNDVDDVGYLNALVGALAGQYPIDTERVFATGSSGGGMMSYKLACETPDLVAAIAPVAATMTVPECQPSAPVSIIHIHGDDDQVIPLEGSVMLELPPVPEVIDEWRLLDACAVGPDVRTEGTATITSWSACASDTVIDLYVIAGLTHHFPTLERGDSVDARDLSWAFFMAHARGSGRTLQVARAGTGTGTVTSSPAGIDCGSDCSESYSAGAAVTLTAAPDVGMGFSGWSGGGCVGTVPTCTVSMTTSATVTATFDLPLFTLTVAKTGRGKGKVTSSPAGISCGADCSQVHATGTSVTLTALPNATTTFAGWSGGGCSGTALTCTLSPTTDTTVTATFNRL